MIFVCSDKISSVTLENNPTLCGCASKWKPASCYSLTVNVDKASEAAYTSTCGASTSCPNISYTVTYQRVAAAPRDQYMVQVGLPNEEAYKVDVVKYENLHNDTTLTVTNVASETSVTKQFSREVMYADHFAVCVTQDTDTDNRHRTCTLLNPPYFRTSSGNGLQATMLGLTLSLLTLALLH